MKRDISYILVVATFLLASCASTVSSDDAEVTEQQSISKMKELAEARVDSVQILQSADQAYGLSQWDQAKNSYQSLLDNNFQNTHIYLRLGNIETILGNLREASNFYGKALETDPLNEKLHFNLATVHLTMVENHLSYYTGLVEDDKIEKKVLDLLYAIDLFSKKNDSN